MVLKVFHILKWTTLVAAIIFMAVWLGETYNSFSNAKEYKKAYRISVFIGSVTMGAGILISILSIKKNTRFWNRCFWILPAFIVFNSINVNKAMGKNDATRFESFISETLQYEGGYVDDPVDRGGRTNWGISWDIWRATAKRYLNQEPTPENLRKLTEHNAKKIYRGEYWDVVGADKIKCQRVAYMIFDWNITSHQARKKVQSMLNEKYGSALQVDGHFGTETIRVINRIEDQHQLLHDIAQARRKHYEDLVRGDQSQRRFKKGWINRVDECINEF